jgi:hypothetical protein
VPIAVGRSVVRLHALAEEQSHGIAEKASRSIGVR